MQAPQSPACPRCLLPLAPEVNSGEDHSLLFTTLHCRCQKASPPEPSLKPLKQKPGSVYASHCRNCGKKLVTTSDKKILTSLFFKPYTCHCQKPELATSATQPGLNQKLSWRYHLQAQAQTKRRTRYENKALSKTKMVLSASDRCALIELKPGELIANTYILEEQIGEGGMGLVFRARHRLLGRPCALKFLAPSAISPQSWELFKREAKILNDLSHPAISVIYDMGLHNNALPFLAMELLQGTTLEELLQKEETLSLGAALEIFVQVAGALSYAHRQKIIHKDIKPANVMLTLSTAGAVTIKLLDFGIAELEGKGNADSEDILGSACYMSPEQFAGEKLTASTDIYSLGCSLFECLTGTLPFDGEEFEEMEEKHKNQPAPSLKAATNSDFPVEIEAVLYKALQKLPERRYRYISEMVVDLERILEGKPLQFARPEEFLAAQNSSQASAAKAKKQHAPGILAASLLIFLPTFTLWKIINKDTSLPTGSSYSITDDLATRGSHGNQGPIQTSGKIKPGADKEITREKAAGKSQALTLSSAEIDNLYESGGLSSAQEIKGPLSKIVNKKGVAQRIFFFPNTYSLGYISQGYTNTPEQAMGTKEYPASASIAFYADPILGKQPHFYQYFDDRAISFLSVIRATKLPAIEVLRKWQNLQILRFRKCVLSQAYFKELRQLPHLSVFMLDQCEFDSQALIDSKLLSKLHDLDLVARGEKNLNFLTVLQALEKEPHQPNLALCGQASNKEIAALTRLKKMEKLSLKGTTLTDYQLGLLSKMQFLQELRIAKSCLTLCTPVAIESLKKSLPKKVKIS